MSMSDELKVLDHGYVKRVESWGSDERIIEAARMSTDKGFQGWGPIHSDDCQRQRDLDVHVTGRQYGCICTPTPGDEKLLRFLWEHKHYTPFEMAGLTLEVQAPIFVFREWHRHRTQSYNELSARYTPLPDLFYVPSMERILAGKQSTINKQGSTPGFTESEGRYVETTLRETYEHCRFVYEELLKAGVARELARVVIPVGQYSRMRASANLRNWLAFLTLRQALNAQWEIRQYANAVGEIVAATFPRTWVLFKGE